MYIKKLILDNYRIYNGVNEIFFSPSEDKNVFIISGMNGFGKTTLLTSLVWCLYGKLMADVEEKFKKEIAESGGYKKFAANNFNRLSKSNGIDTYTVSIVISNIFIPTLPCNELTISRTFHSAKGEESIEILIDGAENELTREVGPEIFINDFILPKEIAKFFFFDAEKIVSLAEIKTIDDKRNLSKAYSEVLGIKKYEDLKTRLEDLRIRLRRDSATALEEEKFEELTKETEQFKKLTLEYDRQKIALNEEKDSKKVASEECQEKLIREGNSMSVSELNELKRSRNKLSEEMEEIKANMKELLELAPFAIAGNKTAEVKNQLNDEIELTQNFMDPALIKSKSKKIEKQIIASAKDFNLNIKQAEKLAGLISDSILTHFSSNGKPNKNFQTILGFTDTEKNEFDAIYSNLKSAFNITFRHLVTKYKDNRITFNKVVRTISNAESKENDLLITEIRTQKNILDTRIKDIDAKLQEISQEIGSLQKDITIKSKVVVELAKKINIGKTDIKKDETAKRLVDSLTVFITKLKEEKKVLLETKFKEELNKLMHKKSFVTRVEFEIEGDIIDINLYNKRGEIIIKDGLSKGEQQIYATALLKALIDESNIKFPVFIDSPLQKLDPTHSRNIICAFYPNLSEQVVLFPLLEKELSEAEYELILPHVKETFLIKNIHEDSSVFVPSPPTKLFKEYKKLNEHIYAY